MVRKSRDWKEGLSEELRKDKETRREYFQALLEEKFTWREAILSIIQTIGVKEYSEMLKGEIKPSNLLNQLKPDHNLTINTLEKITRPLGMEIAFKSKTKKD